MARETYKTSPIRTNPQKQPRTMSTGSVLPGVGAEEGARSTQPDKKPMEVIQNISWDLKHTGNTGEEQVIISFRTSPSRFRDPQTWGVLAVTV